MLRSAEALRASEDLAGAEPPGLLARLASTDALPALAEMLTQTLVDDPSTELGTGRVFRTGFDPELDLSLIHISTSSTSGVPGASAASVASSSGDRTRKKGL